MSEWETYATYDKSEHAITLRLIGELPGLNEITAANRRNKYAGAKQKAEVETAIILQIRRQRGGRPLFPRRYHWRFTWHCKDKRRDPDNIAAGVKFIFDALQTAGIITNDGWDYVATITHNFSVSEELPGVTVEAEVAR